MDFRIQRERDCDNDFGHGKGRIDTFQLGISLPGHLPERRFQGKRLLPGMLCLLFSLQSVDHESNASSNTFTSRAERTSRIAAPEAHAVCRSEREAKIEGG